MDLDDLQRDVLEGLLSGDPHKAEATALRIYSHTAVFKHPFFIVEGRHNIVTLWGWWNRVQWHMAPRPGLTQMWQDASSSKNAGGPTTSVILDLTYEAAPFWTAFLPFKHVARIVVMLHLVPVEQETAPGTTKTKTLYLIQRQEDFIQDDSVVSALLPQPLARPAVILTRWVMWIAGWLICHVYAPLMIEVRAFI